MKLIAAITLLYMSSIASASIICKRAVPPSIIDVEPYEISASKYQDKIASREQEIDYDYQRVQRAKDKYDIVLNRKQSGIRGIVDGNSGKLLHIDYQLNLIRVERESSYWKMHAFRSLQSSLGDMRHEWDDLNRTEVMRQFQGYRNDPNFIEMDMPGGIPDVSPEEVQAYFPQGHTGNAEKLMWQVRMLQAAKMTNLNPSLYDPFVNQAIVNRYHDLNQQETSSSSSSEEYQKALWELTAVIDHDEMAAGKAADLHAGTCRQLNSKIHDLEAKHLCYTQKYNAWSELSAKRPRRA